MNKKNKEVSTVTMENVVEELEQAIDGFSGLICLLMGKGAIENCSIDKLAALLCMMRDNFEKWIKEAHNLVFDDKVKE